MKKITASEAVCEACLKWAGLATAGYGCTIVQTFNENAPPTIVTTHYVSLPDGASAGDEAAVTAFLAAMPDPCAHPAPPSAELVRLQHDWLAVRRDLAALPAVPGSGADPCATIRARLQASADAIFTQLQTAGGPV
jgi:hypothetical protein